MLNPSPINSQKAWINIAPWTSSLLYSFTIFKDFFPLASSCLPAILLMNTLDFTVWNTPRYIWCFVLGIVLLYVAMERFRTSRSLITDLIIPFHPYYQGTTPYYSKKEELSLKDSLWLDPLKNPTKPPCWFKSSTTNEKKKNNRRNKSHKCKSLWLPSPVPHKNRSKCDHLRPNLFFKLQESFKLHWCFFPEPFPVYRNPSWSLASRA